MDLRYAIVDAFAAEPFTGNPAAVVFDAHELNSDLRQLIAREFNLSETAFVRPAGPDAAIGLTWHTPELEVDLCGHATIATVHALIEDGQFASIVADKGTILPIQTPKHLLTVRCEQLGDSARTLIVWLDLPTPQLTKFAFGPSVWAEALGVPRDAFDNGLPVMRTGDDDLLVFVNALPALLGAQPNFSALDSLTRQQKIRGVCLATTQTLNDTTHVQSRFFAPAVGINEDPVTGSVHGPLAAYLVSSGHVPSIDDYAMLNCIQAYPGRAGLVRAVVKREEGSGFNVRIGGQCVTMMKGTLTI